MTSTEKEDSSAPRRRVSCTKCFDALWFCYYLMCMSLFIRGSYDLETYSKDHIMYQDIEFSTPFYQMQQYYRVGKLDDCTQKFSDLFACLSLKTKPISEVEKILEEKETTDAAKHIWVMRTQEEASSHWNETFGHLDDPNC